jgi:hypothetical protein
VCAPAQLHITRPPYNLINKMQKLLGEFGSGHRASSQAHQNLKDSWPKAPQNQVDQAATALATKHLVAYVVLHRGSNTLSSREFPCSLAICHHPCRHTRATLFVQRHRRPAVQEASATAARTCRAVTAYGNVAALIMHAGRHSDKRVREGVKGAATACTPCRAAIASQRLETAQSLRSP